MKRLSKLFWALVLMTIAPVLVYGQATDCPAIVKSALDATNNVCSSTGRNQACYGNIKLTAESQTAASDFTFTKPGDLIGVDGIKTLTLSPFDAKADTWGVALMKLQANLPDTLPGQNVIFVLFGDVQIDNAVDQAATLDVITKQTTNVRQGPSKSDAVLTSAKSGTALVADGRSEDASWLRVHTADLAVQGWASAPLMKVTGDLKTLTVVKADAPRYSPMQAFYFTTGLNDAPCSAAPDSGILIQTPKGAGRISLIANDVEITLGSTAYIQAQAGGEMSISVVEGQGTVTAAGATVIVPAGTRARVPLDNALKANGEPIGPEPYDNAGIAVLPIGILPQAIPITPALTVDAIATLAADIQPLPGKWTKPAGVVTSSTCNSNIIIRISAVTYTVAEGAFDIAQMLSSASTGANSTNAFQVTRDGNTYSVDYDSPSYGEHYTIQVISPTLMQMDVDSIAKGFNGCEVKFSGPVKYVGK